MGNSHSSSSEDAETLPPGQPHHNVAPCGSRGSPPGRHKDQHQHHNLADPILEARNFLRNQALDGARLATLSWDDFLKYISGLNMRCRNMVDSKGKFLVFAIKKGTQDSVLWKATVRICCVKMNQRTGKIESRKFLTLPQFLKLHSTLVSMLDPSNSSNSRSETPTTPTPWGEGLPEEEEGAAGRASTSEEGGSLAGVKEFGASILLENLGIPDSEVLASDLESTCIICMERKPEVILPCAHCYCLPCIEQWNMGQKFCPLCRQQLKSTEEAWVVSEAPEEEEITDYLMQLAEEES